MTNWAELEPGKVREIFEKTFAVNKNTNEIRTCGETLCADCLFYGSYDCKRVKREWLNQTTFEPEKCIDWSKVPVDTPVIVWNSKETVNRYFCRISEDGYFYTFAYGTTSWSSSHIHQERWSHCKLHRLEDVEKYRKKETENGYKEGVL